jgi:hypothetical protein
VTPLWEQRAPGDFIRREPIHVDAKVPAVDGRYRLLVCATPRVTLPEQSAQTTNCSENDIERSYTFHHASRVSIR